MKGLILDRGREIPAKDLSWTATRASGPGGQNVNKLATKVTLRFDLEATEVLSSTQKARLRALAGRRLDADGALLVRAQAERSQAQNLERARQSLRRLVLQALAPPPKRRVATRPSKASKRRRLEAKRRQGDKKRGRSTVGRDEG